MLATPCVVITWPQLDELQLNGEAIRKNGTSYESASCAIRTKFVEIKDRYVAYEVTNTQTCSNFLVSKEIEERWLSVCCLLQSFREATKPGG